MTYSGPLGNRHTGLGAQTLDLKKRFSSFLLNSFFFNNKYIKSSDQWFHNAFRNGLECKNANKREKTQWDGRSERRKNFQRKWFHSFNYVIDHASSRFFFNANSWDCFLWFLLYHLLHLLRSSLRSSGKLTATQIF